MKRHKWMFALIATAFFVTARLGIASYQEHVWGRSVVKLLATRGGGTGFQVNYRGRQYTMTNAHVCEIAEQGYLIAESPLVHTTWIKVQEESRYTDLCLLDPVPGLPALEMGSEEFKKFEGLTVLGHPHLRPLTVTHGMNIVTQYIDVFMGMIMNQEDADKCTLPKNRIISIFWGLFRMCTQHVRANMTNAHIEPGSSGSPVLDSHGRVRGVAFAAAKDDRAAVIPLKDILKFLNSVVRHASRKRA